MFEHLHLKQSCSEFPFKIETPTRTRREGRLSREPLQIEKVISDFDTERFIYYLIRCSRFILNLKCPASQSRRKDVKFHSRWLTSGMMTSCFIPFEQAKTRLNTPEIKSKLTETHIYARYRSLHLMLIQNFLQYFDGHQ